VLVRVRGPVREESGYVCDFAAIKAAFGPVDAMLDHHCLNDVGGLANPTSELLAVWIWDRLVDTIPGLVSVEVRENSSSGCVYRGERQDHRVPTHLLEEL
jgi:6-pyruvoyltetrahydropterin/6-carboxytetrahydropterin synthase